jgi:hypothetical protein
VIAPVVFVKVVFSWSMPSLREGVSTAVLLRPPARSAFRVSPKKPGDINVALKFVDGYARYWPKISADGHNWQPVAANAVQTSEDGTTFNVKLSTDESEACTAGRFMSPGLRPDPKAFYCSAGSIRPR